MSAMVYGLAKVDEKKYRENYDRIFNKENKMNDELRVEIADLKTKIAELEKMLHENAQTMQDMVDGNVALMTRNKKYREALSALRVRRDWQGIEDVDAFISETLSNTNN